MKLFNFQNWCNPYSSVFLNFYDIYGHYDVRGIRNKENPEIDQVYLDYFFRSRDPKISYPYGKGIHFLNYSVESRTSTQMVLTLNKIEITYGGSTHQVFDYSKALFVSTRTEKANSVACVQKLVINRRGSVEFYRFGSIEDPSYPLIVSSQTDDTVEGKTPYNWTLSIKGVNYDKMPENLVNYFLDPDQSLAAERINTDTVGGVDRYPVLAFFPIFSDDYASLNLFTGNSTLEPDLDWRSKDQASGIKRTRVYSDEMTFEESSFKGEYL